MLFFGIKQVYSIVIQIQDEYIGEKKSVCAESATRRPCFLGETF